jgi:hypothetical protein
MSRCTLPRRISLFLLWPALVRTEWLAIAAVVASFTAPALAGLLRFGRFTSYHTLLVKVAVGATALGLFCDAARGVGVAVSGLPRC